MNDIIFIGTLHAGLTPHDELAEVIDGYKPGLLLVEILQDDIDQENVAMYPDEMVFCLARGKQNKIPVAGFDVDIDVLAIEATDADNETVIEEQKVILEQYTWKDANTTKVNDMLFTSQMKKLINSTKRTQREEAMLNNIKSLLHPTQKTVVITGTGHLPFFKKHFPQALFPFC